MTVLEVLRTELTEIIEARKEALAFQPVKDFAEYKHITGVITGLAAALDRVNGLQKHYEED